MKDLTPAQARKAIEAINRRAYALGLRMDDIDERFYNRMCDLRERRKAALAPLRKKLKSCTPAAFDRLELDIENKEADFKDKMDDLRERKREALAPYKAELKALDRKVKMLQPLADKAD